MSQAQVIRAETLKVPGATLYYEVRGTGPVLLLCIPGGPTDAGAFEGLAPLMADEFTVVTYDTRGNSRSVLDGPPSDVTVETHADDAMRLIAALGAERAHVLGSSSGAVIGLELVTRHGECVDTLIAHEPPVMSLLPDAARWRTLTDSVFETYDRDGALAAMQQFAEGVEEGGPKRSQTQPQDEPTPEDIEVMRRVMANFDFFLLHVSRPIGSYVPDIDSLHASSAKVVIGGGEDSGAQGAYRAACALAQRLGSRVVHFPGGHGGYGSHPDAFAERLHEVLARAW